MKGASNKNGRRDFGPPQGRRTTDEDLVLFRELQKREKDRLASLLLPVSDEIELTGATAHHAALFRIPSNKKTSSGRLESADKNDYDWLKTPPATPLFPSLEMEAAATAPEMAVQRELPIFQPLSRFSGSSRGVTRTVEEENPNPKTPKPSPTPLISSFTPTKNLNKAWTNHVTPRESDPHLTLNLTKTDPKPKPKPESSSSRPKSRASTNHIKPRHPDLILASNLTKPNLKPKPKPETSSIPNSRRSTSTIQMMTRHPDPFLASNITKPRPSSRVSASPSIKPVPDRSPTNLIIDKRSLSSTRGRAVGSSISAAELTPTSVVKPSVTRSNAAMSRVRSPARVATAPQTFFGSKMVDKVMSARKNRGGDAAAMKADVGLGGRRRS